MSFPKSLLLLSLISCPAFAFEAKQDPSFGFNPSQDAIIGGEVVGNESRVKKVALKLSMNLRTSAGATGSGTCTGTLIKKDLVLTAAHCVTNLEGQYTILSISVTTSTGRNVAVKGWKFHPGYKRIADSGGSIFGGGQAMLRPIHDVALLKLSEPIDGLTATLPSAALPEGSPEDMVVAGFGQTNPNDDNSSGILYFAWTEGAMKSVMSGQDHQLEMTGVQPCRGDSGGPLFRTDEGKPLVVMGVTSHVKGNCVGEARAISVVHHLSWLRTAAQELGASL